jgi:hypothetical protein
MLSVALLAAVVLQQSAVSAPGRVPVPFDTLALRHANGRDPPRMTAVRIAPGAVRVDGRLVEPAWTLAEPVTGFTQHTPRPGDPASQRTEVKVLYDDEAVYVGARMYDSVSAAIVGRLGRRDSDTQSDLFEVDFDSYHDHRTSFQFVVNALGVKSDQVGSNDFSFGDPAWDPVWDAATQRDSLGWMAELRIPLSQLRFSSAPVQVWGVNFFRYVQRTGEFSVWAFWAPTDQGYASFFGHLLGLENLPQPRRLEVLPYAAGIEEHTDPGAPNNPFNDGSREIGRVGVDLKYGLTSDLTLNATVNPDFGQVEADPAEVNLTAYETYFSERRPFFVEGANIFSGISPGMIPVSGPQFLYSRRIGRAPQGSPVDRGAGAFTDEPTSTTILGAAKLSGRTAGGWSLGVLDAVTAREYAAVDSAGVRFRDEVEPAANYAALRAKREFGAGMTTLGFTGTAVNRRIDDPRLAFLRTAAYAGGLDLGHRFAHGRYSFFAALAGSYIRGDTLAIQLAQRSSARYYQRPDAGYVSYDPAKTSLAGWNAVLGFSKDQGATFYAVGAEATSPGWEINDLGYKTRSDRLSLFVGGGQRWTQPGRVFRNGQVSANVSLGWNFGGDRTTANGALSAYGNLLNHWGGGLGVSGSLQVVNDGLLRGGPAGLSPASWSAFADLYSDDRKPVQGFLFANYVRNTLGGWMAGSSASVGIRPWPTVSISAGPSYSIGLSSQQYVTSVADTTAVATFGRRYVFAEVYQHTLDLTTRLDVTLTPNLSLQLYVQPFVATGDYRRIKQLLAPRTTDYGTFADSASLGNPSFGYRSLRGNSVLRWEYRPGSTLFLVWTTSCSASSPSPAFDASSDLRRLCQGRADNAFAVKASWWLNL